MEDELNEYIEIMDFFRTEKGKKVNDIAQIINVNPTILYNLVRPDGKNTGRKKYLTFVLAKIKELKNEMINNDAMPSNAIDKTIDDKLDNVLQEIISIKRMLKNKTL